MMPNITVHSPCFLRGAFLLGLFLTLFSFANPAAAATCTLKNGISFEYPDGWNVKESSQGIGVGLLNPQYERIGISVRVMEGVALNSLPKDKAEWIRRSRGPQNQEMEVISFEKVSIAGNNAIRVYYTFEYDGSPIYMRRTEFQYGVNQYMANQITIGANWRNKDQIDTIGKILAVIENSLKYK